MNSLRIAVIGAGIGGLACARGLQAGGRPVTVFEREASASARSQGGVLDLHQPTGQAALRAIGLLGRFRELARAEAQELRLVDPVTGALVHREEPAEAYAPEIDRSQLRALLLESLSPGTVRWGHSPDTVTALDDGTARVSFADGATEDFDLVIGADGAWSRTRPAVSSARPAYTGTTLVETVLEDPGTRHPALAALVGPGSMVAGAGETMLGAQRDSGGRVRVSAEFDGVPLGWLSAADPDTVRADLLARLGGWHDRLLDLLRHAEGGFVVRPVYVLPPGHRWDHTPGVTLLGDAAHLLPPHGTGANLALLDGSDLATAITTHDDPDQAARAYEDVMFPRAAAAAEADAEIGALMAEDAAANAGTARELLNERILGPAG